MREQPRFRVKALGAFEQVPGCPDYALSALGEVRIAPLVEDPWRTFNCPGQGDGCVVEFEDAGYEQGARSPFTTRGLSREIHSAASSTCKAHV